MIFIVQCSACFLFEENLNLNKTAQIKIILILLKNRKCRDAWRFATQKAAVRRGGEASARLYGKLFVSQSAARLATDFLTSSYQIKLKLRVVVASLYIPLLIL